MPRFNVDKENENENEKNLKINTMMKLEQTDVVPLDIYSKGIISTDQGFQTVTATTSYEQVVYDKLAEGSNFNVTPQMSKQEANQKLSDLVQEVYAKLAEAQKLADEHELSFGLDVEYGMGGYYDEGQWHPSSQSC